jgi:hypothetical protein
MMASRWESTAGLDWPIQQFVAKEMSQRRKKNEKREQHGKRKAADLPGGLLLGIA